MIRREWKYATASRCLAFPMGQFEEAEKKIENCRTPELFSGQTQSSTRNHFSESNFTR